MYILPFAHLPAVVEIPVWVHLQLLHLLHLVQHLMHVKLGHEELQTSVRVRLTAKTRTSNASWKTGNIF